MALAIWRTVPLILDDVARMIVVVLRVAHPVVLAILLTRFENEVELPPCEVELPPVEQRRHFHNRRRHFQSYRRVQVNMDEETRARIRREKAAKVDAYWQCVRAEEVERDCLAAFSECSASARAMKEGAAEVDAYLQRVREGGKDCLAAFSDGVSRIGRLAARFVVLIVPLILDGVARVIDFLQTRVTSLARAMKKGAAEVDAYLKLLR